MRLEVLAFAALIVVSLAGGSIEAIATSATPYPQASVTIIVPMSEVLQFSDAGNPGPHLSFPTFNVDVDPASNTIFIEASIEVDGGGLIANLSGLESLELTVEGVREAIGGETVIEESYAFDATILSQEAGGKLGISGIVDRRLEKGLEKDGCEGEITGLATMGLPQVGEDLPIIIYFDTSCPEEGFVIEGFLKPDTGNYSLDLIAASAIYSFLRGLEEQAGELGIVSMEVNLVYEPEPAVTVKAQLQGLDGLGSFNVMNRFVVVDYETSYTTNITIDSESDKISLYTVSKFTIISSYLAITDASFDPKEQALSLTITSDPLSIASIAYMACINNLKVNDGVELIETSEGTCEGVVLEAQTMKIEAIKGVARIDGDSESVFITPLVSHALERVVAESALSVYLAEGLWAPGFRVELGGVVIKTGDDLGFGWLLAEILSSGELPYPGVGVRIEGNLKDVFIGLITIPEARLIAITDDGEAQLDPVEHEGSIAFIKYVGPGVYLSAFPQTTSEEAITMTVTRIETLTVTIREVETVTQTITVTETTTIYTDTTPGAGGRAEVEAPQGEGQAPGAGVAFPGIPGAPSSPQGEVAERGELSLYMLTLAAAALALPVVIYIAMGAVRRWPGGSS